MNNPKHSSSFYRLFGVWIFVSSATLSFLITFAPKFTNFAPALVLFAVGVMCSLYVIYTAGNSDRSKSAVYGLIMSALYLIIAGIARSYNEPVVLGATLIVASIAMYINSRYR